MSISMNESDADITTATAAEHPAQRFRVFLAAFLPLFAIYLATARTELPYHIDAATNVFTAWTIGTSGSPVLHDYAELADPQHKGVFAWVVSSEQGPVSQYPPGTALLAAPLYAIWSDAHPVSLSAENAPPGTRVTVPIPNLWPAAIVASLTTAAALGLVALTLLETGGSGRMAVVTAIVGGLGTSAWTVASHQLWQHGPNMLWLSLGVYLGARNRWLGAGFAFSALALTRPPVILVGAVLGVMLLIQRRWLAAVKLLVGVVPGAIGLLAYNAWLFGAPSVSGGYGPAYAENATAGDPMGFLSNIGSAFLDTDYGLFVWSPFVAVGLLGAVTWKTRIPDWSLAAAIGGLAYLVLQLRLNRASGGSGFSYYRYPLETITAAASVLAIGAWRLWNHRTGRFVVAGSCTFGIVAHLVA